jgi:hypothetical protein
MYQVFHLEQSMTAASMGPLQNLTRVCVNARKNTKNLYSREWKNYR